MVDGIESQYSPIIGDVIEPPSYIACPDISIYSGKIGIGIVEII